MGTAIFSFYKSSTLAADLIAGFPKHLWDDWLKVSLYKNKILLAVIDTVMAEEVINMGFIIGHIALVANTNLWSDDDGRNDAALWNTVYQFTEFQIMSDMERMIGEWMQLIYWNSFLFACSVSRRCFLCHAAYSCGFLIALKYPDLTPKMYPKIVYFLPKMYPKGIFA